MADDNPMIRKILCQVFEREEDYELCAEAANGDEAIALAKQYKPDLVILDLAMPGINGIEAAREIKRIMPHVPIILFTLHADMLGSWLQKEKMLIDLVVPKTDAANMVKHVRSLLAA